MPSKRDAYNGVGTIVHADPFHRSARVRCLPPTRRKPTVMQSVPPQDTSRRPAPGPAETGLAKLHPLPFQCWMPSGPPKDMQLALLAQDMLTAQKQYISAPGHCVPRLGETSVHVAEL